jgi:hypothetical protein
MFRATLFFLLLSGVNAQEPAKTTQMESRQEAIAHIELQLEHKRANLKLLEEQIVTGQSGCAQARVAYKQARELCEHAQQSFEDRAKQAVLLQEEVIEQITDLVRERDAVCTETEVTQQHERMRAFYVSTFLQSATWNMQDLEREVCEMEKVLLLLKDGIRSEAECPKTWVHRWKKPHAYDVVTGRPHNYAGSWELREFDPYWPAEFRLCEKYAADEQE